MARAARLVAMTLLTGATACWGTSATSGEVDVVSVDARQQSNGNWTFAVTLRHADEGWDHYADQWDVVGSDGTVFGKRVLLHPHVDEQPFTRSLSDVVIPDGVTEVTIRGRDKVHGYGGKELRIPLAPGN